MSEAAHHDNPQPIESPPTHEHEAQKAAEQQQVSNYELALSFIRNTLSPAQKQEIIQHVTTLPVSRTVQNYLQQTLSLQPLQQAA